MLQQSVNSSYILRFSKVHSDTNPNRKYSIISLQETCYLILTQI